MFEQIIGKVIFFKNGTNPLLPSSNSWLPNDCNQWWKNENNLKIGFFNQVGKKWDYHGSKIQKLSKFGYNFPFEKRKPYVSLVKVTSI